jgi:hypothetical protein
MAKRPKKKPKTEPKWKMVERVAALMESLFNPGATVEHDIFLPDLESPGHRRQCDVVVTAGPEHRRTRTIVEAQRRGKKVEIGHFDAWVAKMRAVGAQHLICVSAAGYPESVIAKAARMGPTVRLITLRELQKDGAAALGDAIRGKFMVETTGTTTFPEVGFETDSATMASLQGSPGGELLQHVEAFRLDDGTRLSLNGVAQRLIAHQPHLLRGLRDGEHRVALGTSEYITYLLRDPPVRVKVRVVAMVKIQRLLVPCELHEYRQIDEDGATHWLQIAQAPRPDGLAPYQITVVFAPGPDGRLQPKTINILGAVAGDMVSARAGNHQVGPVAVVDPPAVAPAAAPL